MKNVITIVYTIFSKCILLERITSAKYKGNKSTFPVLRVEMCYLVPPLSFNGNVGFLQTLSAPSICKFFSAKFIWFVFKNQKHCIFHARWRLSWCCDVESCTKAEITTGNCVTTECRNWAEMKGLIFPFAEDKWIVFGPR